MRVRARKAGMMDAKEWWGMMEDTGRWRKKRKLVEGMVEGMVEGIVEGMVEGAGDARRGAFGYWRYFRRS